MDFLFRVTFLNKGRIKGRRVYVYDEVFDGTTEVFKCFRSLVWLINDQINLFYWVIGPINEWNKQLFIRWFLGDEWSNGSFEI